MALPTESRASGSVNTARMRRRASVGTRTASALLSHYVRFFAGGAEKNVEDEQGTSLADNLAASDGPMNECIAGTELTEILCCTSPRAAGVDGIVLGGPWHHVRICRPCLFRPSLFTLLVPEASALSVVRCKKMDGAWLHRINAQQHQTKTSHATVPSNKKEALAENGAGIANSSNHNQPTTVSHDASTGLLMYIIQDQPPPVVPQGPPSPPCLKSQ